ncbi:hypothetical protein IFM89_023523 [Coptis chinensis]|uniref:Uncharacterized protein n=1 Tax=Coptis chinensis TaxID=261450 RepID=A0A835HN11_9MAGN|nr:hypothetical protein IFM89_023523 [Coptis chinensis]
MQLVSKNVDKISRVLFKPRFVLYQRTSLVQISTLSGTSYSQTRLLPDAQHVVSLSMKTMMNMSRASYTTEATNKPPRNGPTEEVKEIYDKMIKSIEGEIVPPSKEEEERAAVETKKNKGKIVLPRRKIKGQTAPPNTLLWSLVEKCANLDDIVLLFDMLQNLRRFRLSNLRIHDNFNCTLCLKIAEACARVGAIDYGKKALWEHNKYGLTPSVSSANYLLLYAKESNDTKLMVEVMQLLKRNHLPLQPGTADIIFSTCYNVDDWELISKYANKFLKAGVKLRRTTFGTWMKFSAKRGDVKSIWKIENLRSKAMEKHNLDTGFSCAKGFLLEGKPESAAAIIHVLNEKLRDEKRTGITLELQRLVSEWPSEVTKQQKEEDRKSLASSLTRDIPAMVTGLLNMGLEVAVNLDDLNKNEAITF